MSLSTQSNGSLLYPTAIFSEDRKYRYLLTRQWDESRPYIAFMGLNPSTADETKDDPTIRRCMGYAKDWGYGGLIMLNLFAFRSTDPKGLYYIDDPVGSDNDVWIAKISKNVDKVIACWGNHGRYKGRNQQVIQLIKNLYVLGLTKRMQPKHPLYLKKTITPSKWI